MDTAVEELMADISSFKKSLERLARLGEIARDAYARPPEITGDGAGNEGMYYFDTR